ncbi:MAG TPA: pyridoxamine 5'-phosphate oxidase family protein [Rhizomicrobium sp.]|nr:pyridoxamine 5'-phosphate oxidase family protein [Rhizomicrobium sp.]
MMIDAELAGFMESAVMIIVGTRDDALRPQIGRAVGAVVDPAAGGVDLIVSNWQWPETIANIRGNGRLAVTFARPSDYTSYQVKGPATVIPATAAHRACAARYVEAMTATLIGNGVETWVIVSQLIDHETVVLRMAVDMIFVQTPGDKAGRRLEPSQ